MRTKELIEETVVFDDLQVDTEDAWRMVIQYLYLLSYDIKRTGSITPGAECLLHIRVYVLAQKLCMEGLKKMAFEKATTLLVGSYRAPKLPTGGEMADILIAVYGGTSEEWAESDEGKKAKPDNGNDRSSSISSPSSDSSTAAAFSRLFEEEKVVDPMRTLVSSYAASRIIELRNSSEFMQVVKDSGEFASDLVLHVECGAKVRK
jgi:hypothetical protein